MTDYDNNMRGVLFKNTEKTSDNQPDYTGKCEINKKEWRIGAWIKRSKNGKAFMSLSFSEPKEGKKQSRVEDNFDDLEDSQIPF